MKLSSKVLTALNKQMNMEFGSSYIYLSMAAWFESQNFKGMGAWMKKQAHEEWEHGMKIYKYVTDRGNSPELLAIPKPKKDWKNPLNVFQDALKHEQEVTASINKLDDIARAAKDKPTDIFLQWYITEQVEEEGQVEEIIDRIKMAKGESAGLLFLDHGLGQRA